MGCSEASGDDGSVLRTGRQGLYREVSGESLDPCLGRRSTLLKRTGRWEGLGDVVG